MNIYLIGNTIFEMWKIQHVFTSAANETIFLNVLHSISTTPLGYCCRLFANLLSNLKYPAMQLLALGNTKYTVSKATLIIISLA